MNLSTERRKTGREKCFQWYRDMTSQQYFRDKYAHKMWFSRTFTLGDHRRRVASKVQRSSKGKCKKQKAEKHDWCLDLVGRSKQFDKPADISCQLAISPPRWSIHLCVKKVITGDQGINATKECVGNVKWSALKRVKIRWQISFFVVLVLYLVLSF